MSDLSAELKVNYAKFRSGLRKDFVAADKAVDPTGQIFLEAYKRLAAFNSWRVDVLEPLINVDVSAFLLEAQSDGVTSLAFATVGAWRTSLQSLRSMIENVLLALYFADHLVEHQLWLSGKFKIGFGALAEYFGSHPAHASLPEMVNPLHLLKSEYDTLSRSVHGRAPFRMTKDAANTVVCHVSIASRGAYLTRQRETLRAISLLCLMLFHEHLQGTKQQALRHHLSALFPPPDKSSY
jgi:hypothetical protein